MAGAAPARAASPAGDVVGKVSVGYQGWFARQNGFTTLAAAAGRDFSPASGNAVTIGFPAATTRYVRITATANSGRPGNSRRSRCTRSDRVHLGRLQPTAEVYAI